ncbi:MAG: Mrp/NBP35 family ATP-binding protein [Thermoguttaceae bacterium]|nr:Mrp/NBP35 family ATP-binding protein [Planctomycetaceae bacterium]MBQ4143827.1 Mrp/NBP35 family ATP-binding protein [Thermoguttaceae bacterium]
MSESCNHQCSSCSKDCASRHQAPEKEALNELSSVKKVIAVVSGKGGVGKSLVTGLLASMAQREGWKTAVLDADITGPSIPKMFGTERHAQGCDQGIFPEISATGIKLISVNHLLEDPSDPVLWRGPIIAGVVKQFWSNVIWDDVDFMFVDMPPGTGDVALTVFQSLPVDGIVVVTSPQELVSMIVGKALKMAEMMKVPVLGIVENMSWVECDDCGKKIFIYGESRLSEYAAQNGLEILAQLPIKPQIAKACDAGKIETITESFFEPEILKKWMETSKDEL